jgi:hypothetical protein
MSVSTTIDSTLGVVSVIDPSSDTTPGTVTITGLLAPVTVLATGSTLTPTQAGVITLDGGAASLLVMPLATDCAGAMFTVRSVSAFAHILTGSQETNGFLVFTDGTSQGSRATLRPVAGSSVALLSNGKNFLVLGNSGSVTLAGT